MRIPSLLAVSAVAACAAPNNIEVALAPNVISSLDGSTTLTALVATNTTPRSGEDVQVTIDYTDRNGTAHMIAPLSGKTDPTGVFRATVAGLTWDGTGTVTVTHEGITGEATFAVLDRTPPKIEILPPTNDKKVGPGLPLDVQVHVTDEIGVSDVVLDAGPLINQQQRSTVVTSGALDTTVTFRVDIPQNLMGGSTVELHALATDLSGNSAVAAAMVLTVDPTISIAVPPPLTGTLLVDGTTTQLVDPRAIAASPMDGHLYVADAAGTGLCNPSCVWRVDATTGAIDATPVYVATGSANGVAFDATGANMYVSDSQNKIVQLTYTAGAYTAPIACDNLATQRPQDPFHLVVDPTLGVLVADNNRKELERVALPCVATTNGTAFSMNGNFDSPHGVALDPTGRIFMSDDNRNRVYSIDRTTGAATVFGGGFGAPYGIEWLAGGTTQFADTLMVAEFDARVVSSTKGTSSLAAAYLRNAPVDLAFISGTMYVVTGPGNNNRGRIYKVAGF